MNELQLITSKEISKHNFDKYKNDLKRFSEKPDSEFDLPRVEEDTFIFFDHNVTGRELNRLTRTIGDRLVELNKSQIELIREFKVIYDAFESLDKDYISGILSSIKSAERAFNNSIYAIDRAVFAIEELQKAQKDIKETVNIQKRIIKGLSEFNKRLNKNKHLDDIDDMWENEQHLKATIDELNIQFCKLEEEQSGILSSIKSTEIALNNSVYTINKAVYAIEELQKAQKDIKETVDIQKRIIEDLSGFNERLNKNKHLDDVDNMWENEQHLKATIDELNIQLCKLEEEQNSLIAKNEELANLIKNKNDESQKIKYLTIATSILFIIIVVDVLINYLG